MTGLTFTSHCCNAPATPDRLKFVCSKCGQLGPANPDIQVRDVFRIYSRNLSVGVYVDDGLFTGIREKFGSRYLDSEGFNGPGMVRLGWYDQERDPENRFRFIKDEWVPSTEPVGRIPDDVPLGEVLQGRQCLKCGRDAWWTGPPAPAAWECAGGCEKPRPASRSNNRLFDLLDDIEKRVLDANAV